MNRRKGYISIETLIIAAAVTATGFAIFISTKDSLAVASARTLGLTYKLTQDMGGKLDGFLGLGSASNGDWVNDNGDTIRNDISDGKIPVQQLTLSVSPIQTLSINPNLFVGEINLGDINISTGIDATSAIMTRWKNHIGIKPLTQYTVTRGLSTGTAGFRFYDINKIYIGSIEPVVPAGQTSRTFVAPSNAYYLRMVVENTSTSMSWVLVEGTGAVAAGSTLLITATVTNSPLTSGRVIWRIISGDDNILLTCTDSNCLSANITAIKKGNALVRVSTQNNSVFKDITINIP